MLDQRIVDRFPFRTGESRWLVAGYVGSISHNTHVPKEDPASIDDVDILAAVQPPARFLIGLGRWEHWTLQYEELDVTVFALHKLVRLWLRANPNVLGLLWLRPEHYLIRTPEFERLLAIRDAFSSRLAHATFSGYALSQLRGMEKNQYAGYMGTKRKGLVDRYGYDVKHAAHLIRLLRMGQEFLATGILNVYRAHDAEELRAIKRGEWSLKRVQSHAGELFVKMDETLASSPLPDEADAARVEAVLLDVTRAWLAAE